MKVTRVRQDRLMNCLRINKVRKRSQKSKFPKQMRSKWCDTSFALVVPSKHKARDLWGCEMEEDDPFHSLRRLKNVRDPHLQQAQMVLQALTEVIGTICLSFFFLVYHGPLFS